MVDAATADYVAAVASYRAKVRQAVREVEEALVVLDSTVQRETDTRAVHDARLQNLGAAQNRERNGMASALEVEGLKPASPEPPPLPKPAPEPPKPPVATESGLIESNFQVPVPSPLWSSRRLFLGVQAGLGLLLGGWLLASVLRRSRPKKGPSKALLAEASGLEARLHREADLSRLLRSSVRILQLRTAAKSNCQADAVDADTVIDCFRVEGEAAAEIRWLFESDAENQFAGSQHSSPVTGPVKTRVTALLKKLA
jgi:hypothetical protein